MAIPLLPFAFASLRPLAHVFSFGYACAHPPLHRHTMFHDTRQPDAYVHPPRARMHAHCFTIPPALPLAPQLSSHRHYVVDTMYANFMVLHKQNPYNVDISIITIVLSRLNNKKRRRRYNTCGGRSDSDAIIIYYIDAINTRCEWG